MHGSIYDNYCMGCGKYYNLDYILNSDGVPLCSECGSIVKPDVVLYEEPLNMNVTDGALKAIDDADVLIIVGTRFHFMRFFVTFFENLKSNCS